MKVLFRSNQVWIGFWNNSKIFKWQRGPHDNFSLLAPLPTSVARRPPLPVLGRCQPLAPLPQFALSPSVVRNRPLPPGHPFFSCELTPLRSVGRLISLRMSASQHESPSPFTGFWLRCRIFPFIGESHPCLVILQFEQHPHPPSWQNMPQSPDTAATEEHCRPDLFPPPRRRHIVRMRSHPTS
jgi:hypothetical protein